MSPEEIREQFREINKLQAELRRAEKKLLAECGIKEYLRCLHCGQFCADAFMVHNEVWHLAVPDQAERYANMRERGLPDRGLFLHAHCLEQRIDRKLTVLDLSDVPMNEVIRFFVDRED